MSGAFDILGIVHERLEGELRRFSLTYIYYFTYYFTITIFISKPNRRTPSQMVNFTLRVRFILFTRVLFHREFTIRVPGVPAFVADNLRLEFDLFFLTNVQLRLV